ncbi:MAG: alkyl sulfatase dimerization domain-containing protein [Burkholderiaceae bacterium]
MSQQTPPADKPMRPATRFTCEANAAFGPELDYSDTSCFDDAQRGFVGTIPDARIEGKNGQAVWDLSFYRFLEEEISPDTVNPSLWRQARLNRLHGLFEVVPGMYQVRGFDLANLTIIESKTGVILIDPLTFCENATAALALYREHRGDRPIRAVIYSHSHTDHFGGVEGVISAADVASGQVQVIAPDGFLQAAIAETMLAGVPMRRRSMFQFGPTLEPGPRSHIDSGLGKAIGRGTASLIAPTWVIREPIETHEIDGVKIVFQLTPETEAPAEMNFFFPDHRVLNLAENGCHTMHNLCPIRGAKTRDSLGWSKYLDLALEQFVDDTDVVIAQHHWPTWGQERIRRFIAEQRDMYRYLHDQTLRMMSHGMTPDEIADQISMPASIAPSWHARPYYGALAHNVRAIYAHYLGPYDGRPANLNPLPPEKAAVRYLEYMGGPDAVLTRARDDFERGDYRWVVQVLQHVIFADGQNMTARHLCADAMEQMGYQAESSTWRNAYLLGAKELRLGAPPSRAGGAGMFSPRVISMMPLDMVLDFIAIRINGPRAEDMRLKLDWSVTDEKVTRKLLLSHSALSHNEGSHGKAAAAHIKTSRVQLAQLVNSGRSFAESLAAGDVPHDGDTAAIGQLFDLMDTFDSMFNILVP